MHMITRITYTHKYKYGFIYIDIYIHIDIYVYVHIHVSVAWCGRNQNFVQDCLTSWLYRLLLNRYTRTDKVSRSKYCPRRARLFRYGGGVTGTGKGGHEFPFVLPRKLAKVGAEQRCSV